MPEQEDALVAELRALGDALDVGRAADQRAAVRARLTRPAPARRRLRRWLLAGAAALVGAVAVVAPARAAVVDAVGGLLRIAGIEVRGEPRTGGLPATPVPLPSLRDADLAEARRVALFPVRVPAELGAPERVTLADPDSGGAPRVVSMSFRGGAVRFDQFDGALSPGFFKIAADAEWVEVGTGGIWLPGPHPVTYVGRDGAERVETARLAAPTLIWADAGVTYRLEGVRTPEEARRIAGSLT
ncbi:hypothetical protein ACFQFC_00160 [Amorphoplanes digitatis]|uniref:DUF4367 domain-containing protein n=1 Tax=Actinoplanes digitatis TaxID=1868 RepID=A0A7W7HXN1_9ACTN|nr:hypothetical protein [Actinoplanes digitatis]MBB4762588.1 hypothetical protein [Actinoplanes digitatis]GID91911.1 hypothetical protein Adi01nite_13230 [Actinoplanes digitatis]